MHGISQQENMLINKKSERYRLVFIVIIVLVIIQDYTSLPINCTAIHDASLAFCDFVLMTALQVIYLRIAM